MSQNLTPQDQAIWDQVTKDVIPLDNRPEKPCENLARLRVAEPRSVPFSPRMDLHGATIHDAFGRVQEHIYQGSQNGYKRLIIITGRSGQINQELPRWLEKNALVRSVKQLSNGGSWEVTIKPAI
jgi:DNA-nicking Smr family endonuclease